MIKKIVLIEFILSILFFFSACKKNLVENSFYYWRTNFKLSKVENQILTGLNTSSLYIRFFDVDLSKTTLKPEPKGTIFNIDSVPKSISIVPVVFITNRTFLNLSASEVVVLAENILSKINAIHKNYSELQFDCDWSGKTKANYFLFLNHIRSLIQEKIIITCTIRLHQIKYAYKTGTPPVDRGVLMFYNVGDISDLNETNSIYTKKNVLKYTDFIISYKLPLDVALPIFSWCVHYRNNGVIGLISKKQLPHVTDTLHFFKTQNSANFRVKTDYLENGVFYRTDDILKYESISSEELIEAANILRQNLKQKTRKIIFYDLDENNINYYGQETFKKIIAIFS